MAINATNVNEVTVNPTNIRYSLTLDQLSSRTGRLYLQRSQKREDGTWIDDPSVGSKKNIPFPTTPEMTSAIDGIVALLPSLLATFDVTDIVTQYRLRITGNLLVGGILDESVIIQFYTSKVQVKMIPSLTTFLNNNPDLAMPVLTAWDALDTVINNMNATEKWL